MAIAKKNSGSNATSQLISLRVPRTWVAQLKALGDQEGVGYQTVLKRMLNESLDKAMVGHLMVNHSFPPEADEGDTAQPTDEVEGASQRAAEGQQSSLSEDDLNDIFGGVT